MQHSYFGPGSSTWLQVNSQYRVLVNHLQHLQIRRRGVASLLLEQVLCQSQLSIIVEVQVLPRLFKFQKINQISNVFTRQRIVRLLLSTIHWVSVWWRRLKTTTGSASNLRFQTPLLGVTQEGEQHRGTQAETIQMTCEPDPHQ